MAAGAVRAGVLPLEGTSEWESCMQRMPSSASRDAVIRQAAARVGATDSAGGGSGLLLAVRSLWVLHGLVREFLTIVAIV